MEAVQVPGAGRSSWTGTGAQHVLLSSSERVEGPRNGVRRPLSSFPYCKLVSPVPEKTYVVTYLLQPVGKAKFGCLNFVARGKRKFSLSLARSLSLFFFPYGLLSFNLLQTELKCQSRKGYCCSRYIFFFKNRIFPQTSSA